MLTPTPTHDVTLVQGLEVGDMILLEGRNATVTYIEEPREGVCYLRYRRPTERGERHRSMGANTEIHVRKDPA